MSSAGVAAEVRETLVELAAELAVEAGVVALPETVELPEAEGAMVELPEAVAEAGADEALEVVAGAEVTLSLALALVGFWAKTRAGTSNCACARGSARSL